VNEIKVEQKYVLLALINEKRKFKKQKEIEKVEEANEKEVLQ